ncbi:hypothetical protein FXF51_01405 [Nonomuraea sp. PA05]|uniref:hypothetical protein n=1 Tax=Nonomuraea sp. PA05 TaxID=2604466 RepID=UPI0011DAD5AE|nr:hypothetical protein [Nonomuraea sp. PA05]TYB71119.1 hypothetical protein FXF51_01405 [Nonomuraea sp. PA05]
MLEEREIREAAALLAALGARDPDHPLSRQAYRMAAHLRSAAARPAGQGAGPAGSATAPAAEPARRSGGRAAPAAGEAAELARRAEERAALAEQRSRQSAERTKRATVRLVTLRQRQRFLAVRGLLPGGHNGVLGAEAGLNGWVIRAVPPDAGRPLAIAPRWATTAAPAASGAGEGAQLADRTDMIPSPHGAGRRTGMSRQ